MLQQSWSIPTICFSVSVSHSDDDCVCFLSRPEASHKKFGLCIHQIFVQINHVAQDVDQKYPKMHQQTIYRKYFLCICI